MYTHPLGIAYPAIGGGNISQLTIGSQLSFTNTGIHGEHLRIKYLAWPSIKHYLRCVTRCRMAQALFAKIGNDIYRIRHYCYRWLPRLNVVAYI